MLPCQSTCINYQPGCHKNCLKWKLFLDEQELLRKSKKEYLKYYNTRCNMEILSLLALQPRSYSR